MNNPSLLSKEEITELLTLQKDMLTLEIPNCPLPYQVVDALNSAYESFFDEAWSKSLGIGQPTDAEMEEERPNLEAQAREEVVQLFENSLNRWSGSGEPGYSGNIAKVKAWSDNYLQKLGYKSSNPLAAELRRGLTGVLAGIGWTADVRVKTKMIPLDTYTGDVNALGMEGVFTAEIGEGAEEKLVFRVENIYEYANKAAREKLSPYEDCFSLRTATRDNAEDLLLNMAILLEAQNALSFMEANQRTSRNIEEQSPRFQGPDIFTKMIVLRKEGTEGYRDFVLALDSYLRELIIQEMLLGLDKTLGPKLYWDDEGLTGPEDL